MPLFQTPPGKGGKPRREHWTYTPTPNGTNWHAYIAGPCLWFDCHTKGRTKPCLHAVTNGALTCEKCSPFEVPEEVGFQPLYREDTGKPVVVVVHEYSRDQVDALRFHLRVLVGREKIIGSPLWIHKALHHEPRYTSSLPHRMRPADPTESLVRLWGMPELVEWFYKQRGQSDNAVSLPPKVVPVAESNNEGEVKAKIPFPAAELANVMDDVTARAKARIAANEKNAAWLREQAAKPNGDGKKK